MSTGWYLFLFLFIFGIAAQSVNQMGIWDTNYTDTGFTLTTNTVQESVQSVKDAPITVFVVYQWVVNFIVIIGSGIVAVISLPTLFYMLGWPVGTLASALIQLLQLPATLTFFVWIFELVTGRAVG
jgi:hypothetical protein